MRYAFILAEKAVFGVELLCRLLEVSVSGFYDWVAAADSRALRAKRREELIRQLVTRHQEHRCRYGSRRHAAEFGSVGRHRVRGLMSEAGVQAKQRRRYRVTTKSDHRRPVAKNLLNRDFRPIAPNQVWAGDLTYLRTREGWLFLVVILDLYSRKVVGWSMSEKPSRGVVNSALKMAIQRRGVKPGLIFHSDRGCQYTSKEHQRLLEACGIVPSMSGKGDCWDNAVAESFFATIKKELIVDVDGQAREIVRQAVFTYLETYYNSKRRYSKLGYRTPEEFEALSKNGKELMAA